MKTINLNIELTYDDEIMHGKDKEAIDWFYECILTDTKGDLLLHSNEIGDTVGDVKVLSQSDPDIVRIPRMLAESALECMQAYESVEWNNDCEGDNYSESIYELEELLNYKEGV